MDEVEILARNQEAQGLAKALDHRHQLPINGSPSRSILGSLSRNSSNLSEAPIAQSSLASDQATRPASSTNCVLPEHRSGGSRDARDGLESPSGPANKQTYESFWREHGANTKTASQLLDVQRAINASSRPGTSVSSSGPPSRLAPSATIVSASTAAATQLPSPRRRKAPSTRRQAPTLPNIKTANGVSDRSTIPSAGSMHFPVTPPAPPSVASSTSRGPGNFRTPAPRTPSEKAAMEQDAVETLLYMSSPGHSHPQYSKMVPGGNHRQDADRGMIYSPPSSSTNTLLARREDVMSMDETMSKSAHPSHHHYNPHHAALRRVILDHSDDENNNDDDDNDDVDDDSDGEHGGSEDGTTSIEGRSYQSPSSLILQTPDIEESTRNHLHRQPIHRRRDKHNRSLQQQRPRQKQDYLTIPKPATTVTARTSPALASKAAAAVAMMKGKGMLTSTTTAITSPGLLSNQGIRVDGEGRDEIDRILDAMSSDDADDNV